MDLNIYFSFFVVSVVTVGLSFGAIFYYRKKYVLVEWRKENNLEMIALLVQLKSMLAGEDNKQLADRLADGRGDYIVPDCEFAETPEESNFLRREMDKLEEYLSILGLCGMLYKTGIVTREQMYSFVGQRLSDIRDNVHLCTYIHSYPSFYGDLIFLLDSV